MHEGEGVEQEQAPGRMQRGAHGMDCSELGGWGGIRDAATHLDGRCEQVEQRLSGRRLSGPRGNPTPDRQSRLEVLAAASGP